MGSQLHLSLPLVTGRAALEGSGATPPRVCGNHVTIQPMHPAVSVRGPVGKGCHGLTGSSGEGCVGRVTQERDAELGVSSICGGGHAAEDKGTNRESRPAPRRMKKRRKNNWAGASELDSELAPGGLGARAAGERGLSCWGEAARTWSRARAAQDVETNKKTGMF